MSNRSQKPKKAGKSGLFFALLLVAIAGTSLLLAPFVLFALSPAKVEGGAPFYLEISKGQTPYDVCKKLEAATVITDATKLRWLGKLLGTWKKMKAGEYEVNGRMTPIRVLEVLALGVSVVHPVTVREGDNLYEIAATLETKRLARKEEVLKIARDSDWLAKNRIIGSDDSVPPNAEGYLFPDTYHLNRGMTVDDILRMMVDRFESVWSARFQEQAGKLGMSRHEVITLASMIEKETGAPEERKKISSVFHNRLRKKMRLQSDPTTIYGIWERFDGNLHKADLLAPTPYNTYTVAALPMGPISNPGKEAIEAALFPEQSEFLFFVSHNDGTHEFTKNFEDHQAAVRRFQLDRKAREGKSWRDRPGQQANGSGSPGTGKSD